MGVPFEALLPYGIIITVRAIGQFTLGHCSLFSIDVWSEWLWPSLCQALCQRWQEGALEP